MDPTLRTAQYYDERAQDYARTWADVLRPMSERLLHDLPLATATSVLDLATGTGANLPALRESAPHATIIGVDLSPGMLSVARASGATTLVAGNVEHLPFAEATFDLVFCAFAVQHFLDTEASLAQIHRVTSAGGSLGLVAWGDDGTFGADAIWEDLMDRHTPPDPDPLPSRLDRTDAPDKVMALLRKAGFARIDTRAERVAHQFQIDAFLDYYASRGISRRRFAITPPEQRDAFFAAVHPALEALPPEAFRYTPEIVYAVAVKE